MKFQRQRRRGKKFSLANLETLHDVKYHKIIHRKIHGRNIILSVFSWKFQDENTKFLQKRFFKPDIKIVLVSSSQ